MSSFGGVTNLLLVAICGTAVLASIGWVFQSDDSGVVGTNGVRPQAFVGALPSKREVCETMGTTKRMPSAALVTLGLAGASPQPLRVRVLGQGSTSVVRRYSDGVVSLPLPKRVSPAADQKLCIRNSGRESVQLGGENFAGATLDGLIQPFAVSITLIGRPRTWGAQTSALLGRVGSAQAGGGGSMSGWIVVGLFGVAVIVALGAASRFAR
jgi:hypothetical protein